RHSLSGSSIKHLLCAKEWYQKMEMMIDSSKIKNGNINCNDKTNEDEDDEDSDIDSD
ncbi:hypothetical protein VP01_3910g2, partial [Puccinia sorghi]